MTRLPIIGITTDYKEKENTYSKYPWFALRRHYSDCLHKFGCTPVILPITETLENLDFLDGLLISGGDFDIDPKYYGEKIQSDKIQTIQNRTNFEFKVLERFFPYNKPILGICGGSQLLNVFFGGSLIQDIDSFIEHEQPNPRNEISHEIILSNMSKLKILKDSSKIYVNSAHHQAINKIGKNLTIDAYAPDNIIEAFHHNKHPLCMGVQWHPEFLITEFDKNIIKMFTDHAKNNI